jgi:YD repeat-containing protein
MVAYGHIAMIDASHWKLRGPVRSMRGEIAEWDGERTAWKEPRFVLFVVFDAAGRVTQMDQRGVNESIHRKTYAYDADGRVLEETAGTVGERHAHVRRWTYDDHGRVTSIVGTSADGAPTLQHHCTYEAGRRVERITFPAGKTYNAFAVDGSEFFYGAPGAVSQTTYYDEGGKSILSEFHDAAGAVVQRVTFNRDGHGRLLVEEARGPGAFSVPRQPGMSDADFARMKALFEDVWGSTRTAYEYGPDGRLLTRLKVTGRMGEERRTYEYDANGNVAGESGTRVTRDFNSDANGTPQPQIDATHFHKTRYTYAYDGYGNWTERIVSAFDTPSNVERRTIEYYEHV